MKVLFLGGTGFVGAHAVRRLAGLGHDVTVVHRGVTEPDLPGSVHHIHDAGLTFSRGEQFLSGILDELRALEPDVVVHMIPESDVDAEIVMRTFRGVARRVVGISSMDVYRAYGVMHHLEAGPSQPMPLTEESQLRERFYADAPGVEKILAERVFLGDADLPGTVLRWPMVYGPLDPLHRGYAYLRQMDAGRPVILLEKSHAGRRASRGFSENVALSVVLAVTDDSAAGRVYNVGEADAPSEMEWVQAIGEAAGWKGRVIVAPTEDALPHMLQSYETRQDWVVDTTRIRSELGYAESVPRLDALKRTVEWERANPPSSERIPSDEEMASRYAAEDAVLEV
ncbi:MAG: NAD-dependent epimerase/dehydratase family protein [Chloroflexi bacterium]|nr:NAD-dependent epimerase/dehydratase family protein [Chloroflexota bacterium]